MLGVLVVGSAACSFLRGKSNHVGAWHTKHTRRAAPVTRCPTMSASRRTRSHFETSSAAVDDIQPVLLALCNRLKKVGRLGWDGAGRGQAEQP